MNIYCSSLFLTIVVSSVNYVIQCRCTEFDALMLEALSSRESVRKGNRTHEDGVISCPALESSLLLFLPSQAGSITI